MKISREYKVGLLFVAAFLIVFFGINYLKGADIFNKQNKYFAKYDRVDGLVPANPVFINGLKVGQVSDLYFSPDGSMKIIVEYSIDRDIKIPDNSVAMIFSSDLMGSKAVNLILGNSNNICVEGDTLNSDIEGSIKDEVNKQVQPIKKKAESLLLSMDTMVTIIQNVFNETTRKNLSRSFENIKYTVNYLKSTSYNIDTLVSTQKNRLANIISNLEDITQNINNNKGKINNAISNFSSLSDTIANINFAKTLKNTNDALIKVSSVVDKIEKGEGTLGLLINDETLFKDLQTSSSELNLLIKDMRLNPERYVHFSVFGRSAKKNKYVQPVKDSLK